MTENPNNQPPGLLSMSAVGQINYTLKNYAEHSEKFNHDALNQYLDVEKLSPKLTSENVQNPKGFLIFDDTVADRNFPHMLFAGLIMFGLFFEIVNRAPSLIHFQCEFR